MKTERVDNSQGCSEILSASPGAASEDSTQGCAAEELSALSHLTCWPGVWHGDRKVMLFLGRKNL